MTTRASTQGALRIANTDRTPIFDRPKEQEFAT